MGDKIIAELSALFLRDLSKLEVEINLYPHETSLWHIAGDIKNPGGTLCLHLCGNLQHYVGAVLGRTAYIRHRETEFTTRNTPRQKLIDEINITTEAIRSTFSTLDDSILTKEYPEQVFGHPMTTSFFLVHLLSHLNYHLGQVNYHRRLISTNM
jgi:hypothetical protein